jgi:hypothetical protein
VRGLPPSAVTTVQPSSSSSTSGSPEGRHRLDGQHDARLEHHARGPGRAARGSGTYGGSCMAVPMPWPV